VVLEKMSTKSSWRIRLGLAIALGIVVIKFGVIPFYGWKFDVIDEIELLKKSVAHKQAFAGSELEINEALQNVKNSFEQAVGFYYNDFSDVRSIQLKLQKDIEKISLSTGVNIKNTNWLYPSGRNIVHVPIKIMMETKLDRLVEFIKTIENDNKFLSVDILKITSRRNSSVLSVMLEVSAYGIVGQK